MANLEGLVVDLAERPVEEDWLEFKEDWYEPRTLGENTSCLSNVAFHGRETGYLVWGIEDGSHFIVGTDFTLRRNVKGEPLEYFLARQLSPDLASRFKDCTIHGKRAGVLAVPAAEKVPTSFDGVRYFRIGSSKVNLAKHPDREFAQFDVLLHGPATMIGTEAGDAEPFDYAAFVKRFYSNPDEKIEVDIDESYTPNQKTLLINIIAQLEAESKGRQEGSAVSFGMGEGGVQ